jgi:hypothetical protein
VRILEASTDFGGRIKELTGFSDFTIELGAEEIHGHKTTWYDIVKDSGATFAKGKENDVFYIDGEIKNDDDLANDDDFKALQKLVGNIGDYSGSDITAETYLTDQNIAARMLPYGNAVFGNEFGTSNNHLSIKGVADADKLWTAGNQNDLLTDKSFHAILASKFAGIIGTIQYSTQVVGIDYSGSTVTCTKMARPTTATR